jgi:ferredoxin
MEDHVSGAAQSVGMEFFSLDSARCVACGQCVRDCAFKALKLGDGGRPVMAEASRCMRCQHCFAVCPVGAISIDGKKAGDAVRSSGLELPSAASVENWLAVRRSMRTFAPGDVDPAVLDRILKNLGNVPTGCNARSLKFTCYPNRASLDRFRTKFIKTIENHRDGTKLLPRWLAVPAIRMRRGSDDMFFRNAPGMLIISSDETNPAVTTPEVDVAAACAYFEMLAQAHGLATCWCGFLRMVQQVVPELLEETTGIRRTTPFYAMPFGLPGINYPRGVLRTDYAEIGYR